MAVLKRKGSKYWYVVFIKNGKQRWYSTKTEDKLEAQQKELDLKSVLLKQTDEKRLTAFIEKASGKTIPKRGFPLSAVWSEFLKLPNQSNKKQRTLKSKKNIWGAFLKWLGKVHSEIATMSDINRDIAVEYSQELQSKSAQTYNNHRHNLRGIFKALMYKADLTQNPFDVVPTLSAKHTSFRPFTLREVKKIISTADEPWKSAVTISFYTGLRFKDVCFLKWDQVNLKEDLIKLTPAKTERLDKKVIIPISPQLKNALCKIKREAAFVLPFLAKNYGKKIIQSSFSDILTSCKIKTNKDGAVSFHSLRHSFVTMLEESGASRQVSQKLVGHGSPIMTELYSHDNKSAKEAVNKLPSISRKKKKL